MVGFNIEVNLLEKDISTSILEVIKKYKMFEAGDSLVVGVSGGYDSICLLHVLHKLSQTWQLKLYAVHLNHGIRGAEADSDAEYVSDICKKLDITCFIEYFDIPNYAKKTGKSEEEAGREIRYSMFEKVREKTNSNKIVVAQNMNDNVETILMHFMRGAGIEGLIGIDAVRNNIVRPLIETDRADIEEYCKTNNLQPRTDRTNLETIYMRNKTRLQLLPYIRENFNQNIEKTLLRLSDIVKEDNLYLEQQTMEAFKEMALVMKEKTVFDTAKIIKCHKSIQRRLIRLGIEKLLDSYYGFELKHIDGALQLLTEKTGAAIVLPNAIRAYISYDSLIIERIVSTEKDLFYFSLDLEKVNEIKGKDLHIEIKNVERNIFQQQERDAYTVYIDRDKINNGLVYRNRRNGDVFSPIGMRGTKKLKEYFIDEKVAREKRDDIGLIADGSDIVWVIGKRLSEKYKVVNETKNIISIKQIGRNNNG